MIEMCNVIVQIDEPQQSIHFQFSNQSFLLTYHPLSWYAKHHPSTHYYLIWHIFHILFLNKHFSNGILIYKLFCFSTYLYIFWMFFNMFEHCYIWSKSSIYLNHIWISNFGDERIFSSTGRIVFHQICPSTYFVPIRTSTTIYRSSWQFPYYRVLRIHDAQLFYQTSHHQKVNKSL